MNNDTKFLNIEWRMRYSLTNFEDHFGLHGSVILLDPNMCGLGTFVCCFDQLAELIVHIIPLE